MELTKYKICPECGRHNPPSLLACRYCEADLIGVKVVDGTAEESPAPQEETGLGPSAPVSPEPELVRICDCGAENPPQARKCQVCGEDISDMIPVLPEKLNPHQKAFSYGLRSYDGAFSVVVDKPLMTVGREAEWKDYLKNHEYVSRQHARLTIVEGTVFLENLSQTNKTFLNNEALPDATPTALQIGDEIGLGGKVIDGSRQEQAAYFVFQGKL